MWSESLQKLEGMIYLEQLLWFHYISNLSRVHIFNFLQHVAAARDAAKWNFVAFLYKDNKASSKCVKLITETFSLEQAKLTLMH